MIVVAAPGMESEVIQTFRLGAADYLILPLREAEIVQAVERILKQVHERRERDRLEKQLQKTNQELQQRVRCLLYTSDAADELPCVDLGGLRIIKKKNNIPYTPDTQL